MVSREPQAARKLIVIRIVGLNVLAFFIMWTYAVARPAVESLFLESYSSQGLPLAWGLVSLTSIASASIYNRFIGGCGLIQLFGHTSIISGLCLIVLLILRAFHLPVDYFLYIWKDVYIVMLVEIFYSFSNAIFPIHAARWLYGLFGVTSAIGGIAGSAAVKFIVESAGTVEMLYSVPLVLIGMGIATLFFARYAEDVVGTEPSPREMNHFSDRARRSHWNHRRDARRAPPGGSRPTQSKACDFEGESSGGRKMDRRSGRPSLSKAMRVVWRSRYLLLILELIVLVQVAITLIDFEFNRVVEQVYSKTDARTAAVGFVYGIVGGVNVGLHALTGPILRLLGVPITLLSIPVLLGASGGYFAVFPSFMTVAIVKVVSKGFDYTLFRAAKEILYIPLGLEEKTLGKSVVDMVTYRMAKGFASLLVLGLIALHLHRVITPLTLGMIVAWTLLTVVIVKRFRRIVSRRDEITRTLAK